MTANSPPNHAWTAGEMLQRGEEALMLRYLLNQQAPTSGHWPLPDGSAVSWNYATGCYRFASPDGASELRYAGMQPSVPYLNAAYLTWHILKRAETDAGANACIANDPPLSEAEAMTICPELNELVTQAVDHFEPHEDISVLMEADAQSVVHRVRRQIPADRWSAIVAAIADRLRQES